MMVALLAFGAGFYYDLPFGYFLLGFLMLLIDVNVKWTN